MKHNEALYPELSRFCVHSPSDLAVPSHKYSQPSSTAGNSAENLVKAFKLKENHLVSEWENLGKRPDPNPRRTTTTTTTTHLWGLPSQHECLSAFTAWNATLITATPHGLTPLQASHSAIPQSQNRSQEFSHFRTEGHLAQQVDQSWICSPLSCLTHSA